MSEFDSLRQEYQHCRATYDYEKKLYHDHLESLQVMEKNYITMAREVEKLRAELTSAANVDRRNGGPYGGTAGYNENEASGNHHVGQNVYGDGYGVPQGHGPVPVASGGAPIAAAPAYVGGQPGPAPPGPVPPRPGYEAPRVPGYDPQRGPSYDAQRGPGYGVQKGPCFDAQTGSGHAAQKGPHYEALRGQGFDTQWGQGYEAQ